MNPTGSHELHAVLRVEKIQDGESVFVLQPTAVVRETRFDLLFAEDLVNAHAQTTAQAGTQRVNMFHLWRKGKEIGSGLVNYQPEDHSFYFTGLDAFVPAYAKKRTTGPLSVIDPKWFEDADRLCFDSSPQTVRQNLEQHFYRRVPLPPILRFAR